MPRDPLDAVIRIRKAAVDDARRGLAASLRTEAGKQLAADAAETLIAIEGEFAASVTADDQAVEAFAKWLPSARAAAAAAREAHEVALADVAVTRAALSAARAAAEAAAKLLARRAEEHAAAADRKAQLEMDEVAARRQ